MRQPFCALLGGLQYQCALMCYNVEMIFSKTLHTNTSCLVVTSDRERERKSPNKLTPGCHLFREPPAKVRVVSGRQAGVGGTLHRDEDPRRYRERVPRLPAAGQPHAHQQRPLHAGRHQQVWDGPEGGGGSFHVQALGR